MIEAAAAFVLILVYLAALYATRLRMPLAILAILFGVATVGLALHNIVTAPIYEVGLRFLTMALFWAGPPLVGRVLRWQQDRAVTGHPAEEVAIAEARRYLGHIR